MSKATPGRFSGEAQVKSRGSSRKGATLSSHERRSHRLADFLRARFGMGPSWRFPAKASKDTVTLELVITKPSVSTRISMVTRDTLCCILNNTLFNRLQVTVKMASAR